MDDTPLSGELSPPEPEAAEKEAPVTAPRPAGGVARAVALVGLGLLAGLGAGWALFHEDGPSPATGDGGSGGPRVVSSGVDITNDPTLGPAGAPVTIIEFSDFDCPFCTRFAQRTAPQLRRQYGERIRWVFVNLPLRSIHPRAYEAALAGECAHEQGKFWDWYDTMFSGRYDSTGEGLSGAARAIELDPDRFEQCLAEAQYAREVALDLQEAEKFYILGTPTFFINGLRIEGAQPAERFAVVIDSILGGS
jgi:protein-disulfide isomerase